MGPQGLGITSGLGRGFEKRSEEHAVCRGERSEEQLWCRDWSSGSGQGLEDGRRKKEEGRGKKQYKQYKQY